MTFEPYDIVVVGAGHAGAEAAAAAARLGAKVMLVTQMLDNICQMSCNPAMGGVAKGQIVREIDALGGWSGIVTDRSAIQFRMLNLSKGPAMWSPRAQCDRMLFSQNWRRVMGSTPPVGSSRNTISGLCMVATMKASFCLHPSGNAFTRSSAWSLKLMCSNSSCERWRMSSLRMP